ncbi:MipA/OmpV family protein [Planctobacterium marinum]|uniref:MipA/OmpV family protein n=1 Tax=Planctobacterium marinum TaxID=1631968 RepID=UPI001E46F2C8|nr:MipA/OmpV family protein [Planctobacterium marinum]MCC2603999.1 MipA/OmpV family protein [Planctobacterium marinum]
MFKKTLSLFFAILIISPVSAEPVYEFGIGVAAASLPSYPGSDDQVYYALPLPYFYYQDEYITVDREGLIGSIFEFEHWGLDVSFSGGIPVNSDDSTVREGMPDLDWTLEAGPKLEYYFTDKDNTDGYLRTHIYLRKVFATDLSYLSSVGNRMGLGFEHKRIILVSDNLPMTWTSQLTLNWADGGAQDYFYGVSSLYANENRPEYIGQSGYASTELSGGITVNIEQLVIGAFVRYQNFSGAASVNSALLQGNSNFSFGIGVIWVLGSNR